MGDAEHHDLQERIGHLIQERSAEFLTRTDDQEEADRDTPTTGVLINWFLICEWVGDDGQKWLSYHRNNDQATWEARGLLTEAVADLP